MKRNRLGTHTLPTVLFVDMNSFFASCEQQVNYWLRGRPVGVCVYTGRHGCVIAPSIEAKLRGVKTGMRLDEAIVLCPDLVPIETHPNRYREFHVKIIDVLRQFSDDVVPKSIDEAVVDLTNYQLVYKDVRQTALAIKQAIREKVGDWLRCSIGIAPNVFLAKLASDIQKPDGMTLITPETIDDVLRSLTLTDLPGIGQRMAARLQAGGVHTPIDLRYAKPEHLRAVCQSIVGWHWHLRLNFGGEVDFDTVEETKSMSAMRTISADQRCSPERLDELLQSLCLTLERRMVRKELFCQDLSFSCRYHSGKTYNYEVHFTEPKQDGPELYRIIRERLDKFQVAHRCEPVLNEQLRSMCVAVFRFIPAEVVPLSLFENDTRKATLRKTLYELKTKFGADKLIRATELRDNPVYRDVIGFGNIKDL
ncbi:MULTISPECIES: DNA polymerase IV [unclassified Spirosoma]|uniref:DNA polymerase Y family protein n=1 Tax=unclassified Spirosoma TaxID=2621999 RepID=UPI00095DC65A|nr:MULTISPECIES: DNA polymerase IV [unclassified Spirosoma]MBN8825032.1 DNA polymerase IV [Spirosoma sp.]OJW73326.1 MAG: DNA polymerase IV [Spirosoma sp. 48-14]